MEHENTVEVPLKYRAAGRARWQRWLSKNEESEWEMLEARTDEWRDGCVIMETISEVAQKEPSPRLRRRYTEILCKELNTRSKLGESDELCSEDGFSDLITVLTEPRLGALDHKEDFRVRDLEILLEACRQSIGRSELAAVRYWFSTGEFGRGRAFYELGTAWSYFISKCEGSVHSHGKYQVEMQVVDPLNGTVLLKKKIGSVMVESNSPNLVNEGFQSVIKKILPTDKEIGEEIKRIAHLSQDRIKAHSFQVQLVEIDHSPIDYRSTRAAFRIRKGAKAYDIVNDFKDDETSSWCPCDKMGRSLAANLIPRGFRLSIDDGDCTLNYEYPLGMDVVAKILGKYGFNDVVQNNECFDEANQSKVEGG